ncbi:MAG TPA: hypothetical protein VMF55_02030 [Solirubrobacterales bacterium]|nr:hypothetical protein [Solirubrobacterales bacterium]
MIEDETQGHQAEDTAETVAGANGIDAALESTVASGEDESSGSRPSGLNPGAGNSLAAISRPTVLILAGDVETGKTSIFAALYERFGRGPFAGRLFAGSVTIPGFERRCHGWRVASGVHAPLMPHTPLTELYWLHLRIRDAERKRPLQDLLFADYNGEIYADIASGADSEVDRSFLRRGDHVGVVLDGGKLSAVTEREAALQRASYLVAALSEPGVLVDPRALFIVMSKYDLVAAASESERVVAEETAAKVGEQIKQKTGHEPPILRVAARSQTELFPLGHGLNELLDLMSERPALYARNDPTIEPSTDPFAGFSA